MCEVKNCRNISKIYYINEDFYISLNKDQVANWAKYVDIKKVTIYELSAVFRKAWIRGVREVKARKSAKKLKDKNI